MTDNLASSGAYMITEAHLDEVRQLFPAAEVERSEEAGPDDGTFYLSDDTVVAFVGHAALRFQVWPDGDMPAWQCEAFRRCGEGATAGEAYAGLRRDLHELRKRIDVTMSVFETVQQLQDATKEEEMSRGVDAIAEERRRQQVEEGWRATDDDRYLNKELVRAALAYAGAGGGLVVAVDASMASHVDGSLLQPVDPWPWSPLWDKRPPPGAGYDEKRRALVKAGALIAAEIDRLDRAEGSCTEMA